MGIAACRQSRDREQKVRCVWRVDGVGDGLGGALCGDEAGIAVLPTVDLVVEKLPPRHRIRDRR
jgi:hypothetical protein